MIERISGTKDILPAEALRWQYIEQLSRDTFSLFNYEEIRTPLIEEADLFQRSLGQSSDIIQKQMFLINREDGAYALRPEGTASIVRAYIENNLDKTLGFAKFYYIGPMFRRERPQKGRLRQFHHIGCEVIGSPSSAVDVEVISLAAALLKALEIEGFRIRLNSLGCSQDKEKLTQVIRDSFLPLAADFCPDCQIRLGHNPLRILDCKNQVCKDIIARLPFQDKYLCADCRKHLDAVTAGLDSTGITYELDPYLVRGLDYYTRTVFEVSHSGLGAQDALGAGGRYDTLIEQLGGPEMPAVGFAFGVERLLLVEPVGKDRKKQPVIYIITMGQRANESGLRLLSGLRKNNIACDTNYQNQSLKGAMRSANDIGAAAVIIIGDNELEKGVVVLKDMQTSQQEEIRQDEIVEQIKAKLRDYTLNSKC